MESPTPSLDQILRDALTPTPGAVERLVDVALAAPRAVRSWRAAILAAAVVGAVAVLWIFRPASEVIQEPTAVQIFSRGGVVVAIRPGFTELVSGSDPSTPGDTAPASLFISTATTRFVIKGDS